MLLFRSKLAGSDNKPDPNPGNKPEGNSGDKSNSNQDGNPGNKPETNPGDKPSSKPEPSNIRQVSSSTRLVRLIEKQPEG